MCLGGQLNAALLIVDGRCVESTPEVLFCDCLMEILQSRGAETEEHKMCFNAAHNQKMRVPANLMVPEEQFC